MKVMIYISLIAFLFFQFEIAMSSPNNAGNSPPLSATNSQFNTSKSSAGNSKDSSLNNDWDRKVDEAYLILNQRIYFENVVDQLINRFSKTKPTEKQRQEILQKIIGAYKKELKKRFNKDELDYVIKIYGHDLFKRVDALNHDFLMPRKIEKVMNQ